MHLLRSYVNKLSISAPILLSGFAIFVAGTTFFFVKQAGYPVCCDAKDYFEMAIWLRGNGIEAVGTYDYIRTFGYTWFLTGVLRLSSFLVLPWYLVLVWLQAGLYFIAVIFLSAVIGRQAPKVSSAIYLALCSNFFVWPFFSVLLTDSLALSLCLLAITGLIWVETTRAANGSFFVGVIIFLILFLSSSATIIRPASLWVLVLAVLMIIRWIVLKKITATLGIFTAITGTLPLFIQASLNYWKFKSLTFLPSMDLGKIQSELGLQEIKFSTFLNGPGVFTIRYKATKLFPSLEGESGFIGWAISHPFDAIHFLYMKIIAAFDFDFVVPYPETNPNGSTITASIAIAIFSLGLVGIIYQLTSGKLENFGPRWLPAGIVFLNLALVIQARVETRYSLVMLTFLIVICVVFVNYLITCSSIRLRIITLTATIIIWASSMLTTQIIHSQAVIVGG